MGRSQESFSKREKEKKKAKKKKEKQLKKEQRQEENNQGGSLDDMIAYVDAYGNLTDKPPEDQEREPEEIEAEDIVIGVPPKEDSGEPDVNIGTVAFYDTSKGFGFINDNNNGEKYFFHINNVNFEIQENDKVTYDVVRGRKGMDAVNVELA
ncbi:DNA-binding protein [Brumimicrobium salinarum]|uniref:DNA-binding protein n=1 Tax=Brumimicrobium salinarum TaxID=2058658 RepID=A0A2I0R562_9FLAO|nr:cold shock domain-containing protein [Brumimicrobium salinarum]PKR81695.1 DNA-binding protein [Brumimicrobium salinarum]